MIDPESQSGTNRIVPNGLSDEGSQALRNLSEFLGTSQSLSETLGLSEVASPKRLENHDFSGPSRFRAQIQQPETLSDSTNFVSFGHLFCQDLDLAILLHKDVHSGACQNLSSRLSPKLFESRFSAWTAPPVTAL